VASAAPKQRRRWRRWLLVGVLAMVVGGWWVSAIAAIVRIRNHQLVLEQTYRVSKSLENSYS
jgi:hypothetical protein